MLRGILSVAVTALVLIAAPIGAHADVLLDPATLHIGTGFGTPCDVGCGGDPNTISGNTFSVYLNGSGDLSDPIILIVGVPDYGFGTTEPTLTGATLYDENTGSGTSVNITPLGTANNSGDGALNNGDANAYEEARFNDSTNSSNNWTNWGGLDPTVVEYDLYAFSLETALDGGDLINVTGTFTTGSVVIAYGCEPGTTVGGSGDALDGSCAAGTGKTYTTPFTEAGFVNVPEPTTQVLLGFALLGLGTLARRRRRAE